MKGWLKRIRGAIGMGLIWAGGGAAVGGLIELISNIFPGLPLGFVDMWIPFLAIPGLVGGVLFSKTLGLAARGRRFEELTYGRVALWGAACGVGVGAFMGVLGMGPLIYPPAMLMSALGATLTLSFARMAEGRESIGSGEDLDEVGLTASEKKELLG